MLSSISSAKPGSKKPKYSRFTQQELPACRPLLTPTWVILSLFLVGAVFIPLGAICLSASNSVKEVNYRYDNVCLNGSQAENDARIRDYVVYPNKSCDIVVEIPTTMEPPIYVYYQLTNFYQNHRRYVKSRSDTQLAGTNVTGSGLDVCQPEAYLGDNSAYPITPCGLIAWSLFNDTFAVSTAVGAPVTVNTTGISWPSDRNKKFGPVPSINFNTNATLRGGAPLIPQNETLAQAENLQVWMRTAALSTFRKLYGRITTQLVAGTLLNVRVLNVYNSYAYDGQKTLVISTASWLGGKNSFLGLAYITVGGICIALALVFFVLQFTNPRPLGDTSYLSWNKKGAGHDGHAPSAAAAGGAASG